MRYMFLIYSDEALGENVSEQEMGEWMTAYNNFTDEARQKGVLLAGDALQPTRSATTVRVRDGKKLVTDGPFAETKEALGGFYILDCKDLDEALVWAAKIPGAKAGSIEVRPIIEY